MSLMCQDVQGSPLHFSVWSNVTRNNGGTKAQVVQRLYNHLQSLRLEVQRSNHSNDSGPDPDGSDDSAAEDDQQSDSTQESNGGQRSGETDSEDALTTAQRRELARTVSSMLQKSSTRRQRHSRSPHPQFPIPSAHVSLTHEVSLEMPPTPYGIINVPAGPHLPTSHLDPWKPPPLAQPWVPTTSAQVGQTVSPTSTAAHNSHLLLLSAEDCSR